MGAPSEEILDLTFSSLMGIATPDQESRLLHLLETDPSIQAPYLDAILLFTQLHRRNGASLFVTKNKKPVYDPELVKVLLEEERCAPAIENKVPEDTRTVVPAKKTATVNKLWPTLALVSTAAMLLIVLGAHLNTRLKPVPVATLH